MPRVKHNNKVEKKYFFDSANREKRGEIYKRKLISFLPILKDENINIHGTYISPDDSL